MVGTDRRSRRGPGAGPGEAGRRLRRLAESAGRPPHFVIESIRGVGYRLTEGASDRLEELDAVT